MEITPTIQTLNEKKLVGKRMTMSFVDNGTGELWIQFMLLRKLIKNNLTNELISLQIYKPKHFAEFDPANEFEKWAAAEVSDYDNVPQGMETFTLVSGLYATFIYKGSSANTGIFQYIFRTWLPNSPYTLDDRPHFEILGEKYRNNDPESEEEIWIPIKPK